MKQVITCLLIVLIHGENCSSLGRKENDAAFATLKDRSEKNEHFKILIIDNFFKLSNPSVLLRYLLTFIL